MLFQIETAWTCYSNIFWEKLIESGTTGVFYRVTFGPLKTGPTQVGWECECRGFIGKGTCKHIMEAQRLRCGWNEDQIPGLMPSLAGQCMNEACPECGGTVRLMSWPT